MATADFSPSLHSGAALQTRLSRLARRRNAQKMSRALVRAAIPGVGLAALSVLLWKLHIIPDGPMWAPAAIIGAFVLWGVRNGRLQRAGTFAAACDADQVLDWDDRLSSALAFVSPDQVQRQTVIAPQHGVWARFKAALLPKFATSTAPAVPPTNLVPALVDEASARAQNLDPRRVYPLPFDRPTQILTVLGVLFVGFCLMPDVPIFQSPQEKKQVAAMQSAGEKLVAVAKNVRKTESPKAAEVNRLARRLEKLGQKMVRGRMTKRAALTDIGELRQQLQKAQKKNAQPQSSSELPQIAEALRQTPLQSQSGRKVQQHLAQNKWDEAAKELENLANKVENNQLSQAEKQKTAQDLKKTAQELRSRGGEANKQAADQLENAAKQLEQKQTGGNQEPQNQGQQPQTPQQKNGPQQGQNGQQQNPQGQNQQGQNQQGQNQQQNPQGQNQQGQNPQQNSQGQNQQGQNQQGQQGQNSQSQNPQGQNQQGQQGQNPQGQNSPQSGGNQQQQPQGGQNGQPKAGGQSQSPNGQNGNQSAADAMRNMANGLRQGSSNGSNSQNLQDMMNKLRDAENQTGSNGGQQFGQGQPSQSGAGNMPGQDGRGSVTPGKELKPSDPHGQVGGGAGLGPRNNAQGVQSGGGVSDKKSTRTGDKRRYQDVWSDRLPKTRQKIDRVKGKWGGNGEIEQMPTKGEGKGGQARTPYYEVYESYKRDAEDAVSRDSVPPAYKQPVKNYFESIKP